MSVPRRRVVKRRWFLSGSGSLRTSDAYSPFRTLSKGAKVGHTSGRVTFPSSTVSETLVVSAPGTLHHRCPGSLTEERGTPGSLR